MGAVALGNQARVERMGGQGMYESANREIAQGVRGAFQNTDTAIRGASQNISDAYQAGGIPAAIGATVRNTAVPALGFAADVGRGVKTLIDPAANALKTAVTGDPTPIDGTRPALGFGARPTSEPTASTTASLRTSAAPARPPAAQGFNPSALTEQQRNDAGDAYRSAWQRETPTGMRGANDQALGFYNAEEQVRGSNVTARRGANGVMEFSGNGEGALPQSYTQGFDMALGNERMARANAIRQGMTAPESGQGYGFGRQGPSGGVIGDSSSAQRERKRLVDAASTPYRGAQNGQLTANQLRTLAGLQEMDQRATTEAANQQAATERAAMQEAGANTRAFSRDQTDSRRVASEERVRDYEARGLERVEKLYTAYENAKTPEERAAVAEQIRVMNGREGPQERPLRDNFITVKQAVRDDKGNVLGEEERLVDLRTYAQQPQGAQALPPINENPAVLKIMQNTALTREQRAAQIRALGYQ